MTMTTTTTASTDNALTEPTEVDEIEAHDESEPDEVTYSWRDPGDDDHDLDAETIEEAREAVRDGLRDECQAYVDDGDVDAEDRRLGYVEATGYLYTHINGVHTETEHITERLELVRRWTVWLGSEADVWRHRGYEVSGETVYADTEDEARNVVSRTHGDLDDLVSVDVDGGTYWYATQADADADSDGTSALAIVEREQ